MILAPLFGAPIAKFLTDAGAPNVGGTVLAYLAGSTTPALMYGDASGGSSFTSKVLDASGSAALFGGTFAYKIDVQDVNGVSLMGYPIDNVVGSYTVGAVQSMQTLSPTINANGFANTFNATINKAGSGTNPSFATVEIVAPTIGAGASTLTEAASLYIPAAPTGATSNYAVHVAGGLSKLDGGAQVPQVSSSASSVLTIGSNIIVPTGSVHHVGAGLIKTITVPAGVVGPWVLWLVPDVAFTYDATGNLVVPSGGGTAVVNKAMALVWDGTKFTPSY